MGAHVKLSSQSVAVGYYKLSTPVYTAYINITQIIQHKVS